MDQKYDGPLPRAEIRADGRRLTRTDVTNDWGLSLRWVVSRGGKVVATANARADLTYEHLDAAPGTYEVVLQMWKYVDYKKGPDGEFTASKYVDVSNKVTFTI
jgi:hypothetical protein